MYYIIFLESCNGVMTLIFFPDDFIGGMTEGFKPGSPYSDVAQSPMGIPRNVFVVDSIGNSQYILTLPTLYFSFFFPIPPLPSRTATNHPSQLPPSSQHKHSSFLYFCTWSQLPFLWILLFFVSKSILFSFNI